MGKSKSQKRRRGKIAEHVIQRFKERYDMEITQHDISILEAMYRDGKYVLTSKKPKNVELVLIKHKKTVISAMFGLGGVLLTVYPPGKV